MSEHDGKAASESSQRRNRPSSRGGSVHNGSTLTDTQAALLARDRALQLRLLPALRHGVHAEPLVRTGLDALLPRPWPTSARWHERWLALLSVLAILSGFITPFRIAFLRPGVTSGVAGWELFCDILFTLNMCVHATCVLPPGMADASRAQIASKYARTFVTRDFVAALPYDFIAYACGLRNRDALFVLGFMRLRRLRRTFEAMATYEGDLRLPYSTLRALRFTLYTLLQVHGFACAFGFLAQREGGAANWLNVGEALKASTHAHDAWPHYLLSLYWSTTTFCGVGYGDMTPQNPREYVRSAYACFARVYPG